MSTDTETALEPVILGTDEGEALWFLGMLIVVKVGGASTGGRLAVVEQRASRGMGSPLHVHHREDEWFHVIEGEVTFWCDGRTSVLGPGGFAHLPVGLPHTFVVSSDTARFHLSAGPAGFEDFVRAASVPAERVEIPPPSTEPPDVAALTALAATYGIDILGPPGIPG